jgi:hypothetical protein
MSSREADELLKLQCSHRCIYVFRLKFRRLFKDVFAS